jgi:hypothetical protein
MKKKVKILIPGILASPEPFRFIKRSEKDIWNPTIHNINQHSYDYVKLHRFTGTIDIGLPDKHTLAVTFDGSFIIPAIPEFKNIHIAVDKFNDFFGRLLLGGVYIQAIDATYVQKCLVYQNHYFKSFDMANNAFVELKNSFRHKHASVKDNIILQNTNYILLKDLIEAFESGSKYFAKIKNLTPSILVKGVSAFINNSFAESLIYNWVSIEQIIDFIWEKELVNLKNKEVVVGRKDFLKDNRTWASSTKIEMFYQKEIIDVKVYNKLSIIRKARNRFIHTGSTPEKDTAEVAYSTLFELISLVDSNYKINNKFDSIKKQYENLDPIKRTFYDKRPSIIENVQYWLDAPIPDIPGDEKWDSNKYEYEIGFEFEKKAST